MNQEIQNENKPMRPINKVMAVVDSIGMLLCVIIFICIGAITGNWGYWTLIFLPEVIVSLYKAIREKRCTYFNYVFLSLFVYFFINITLGYNLWHPLWLVFLGIPLYYTLAASIDVNFLRKKK